MLTADLEKQAAELQEEEFPVATPVINIPHISARWFIQWNTTSCFLDTNCDWWWLDVCKSPTDSITMSHWLRCGCCVPACLAGWFVWREPWWEWAASDPCAPGWLSDAGPAQPHCLWLCSTGNTLPPPKYAHTHTLPLWGIYTKMTFLRAFTHLPFVFHRLVWEAGMSQSFIYPHPQFSSHTDCRLADHQVSMLCLGKNLIFCGWEKTWELEWC